MKKKGKKRPRPASFVFSLTRSDKEAFSLAREKIWEAVSVRVYVMCERVCFMCTSPPLIPHGKHEREDMRKNTKMLTLQNREKYSFLSLCLCSSFLKPNTA